MVQKIEICAFMAKGPGSIPGKVTKILKAAQPKKKKKMNPDLCSASKIVQQVTSVQSQEYRLMPPLLITLNCGKKKFNRHRFFFHISCA